MIYKQQKRLGWIAFGYPSNTPPKTSDGKKYLCTNCIGEMQVCIWDGRANEWIYDANDMVNYETRHASCETAAMTAFDLFNKKLPKNKKLTDDDLDELTNFCIEKSLINRVSPAYFDDVEWYMELPELPNDVHIHAKDGDSFQAEIFEQELDLMSHIEQAIKDYSRAKAKATKLDGVTDAP